MPGSHRIIQNRLEGPAGQLLEPRGSLRETQKTLRCHDDERTLSRPASLPPQNVLIQVNLDDEPQKGGIGAAGLLPLARHIAALPRLAAVVALGRIAHDSTLAALGARRAAFPFAHGARHEVRPALVLFDSFHCSRYNTNTGKLTPEMFRAVFAAVREHLAGAGVRPSGSDTISPRSK